ncbi:hypothetical protein F0562_003193 [Nyssa sinensis]|uniref:HAT C-terminal dimerisation domain-containing protein n=1 Tax=Nyssa sinensis TaxID=561372 RepID=A0A5J5BVU7_9ASTE|nr:hypothetical protein F0562_003193 [Nyssa sinensis]
MVEKVAEKVEKVADEVMDKLPICFVENLAKETATNAHLEKGLSQKEQSDEHIIEQSSSTTSKRKRTTSKVWDNFEKLSITADGKQKASCKKCKQEYIADAKSEHEGNRDLHSFLNPTVKPITRNTAKSDVLKLYKREKDKLQHVIESIPSRICLTFDLWSSIATYGYLALTAHYVDENWILQKKILSFHHMPPPHSGPILAEKVIHLLKEWGIEKKVFSLTLDNAKYNDGLIDVLKCHLSLIDTLFCGGEFFHMRCGAHILNLIVQAGLKVIDEAVNKIRESVKYVRGSERRKIKFAECIAQLSLSCSKKEFDIYESQHYGLTRNKSQLDLFLEEQKFDRKQDLDILSYWKANKLRYPELALMARDILSIPITTVASESAFSIGSQILNNIAVQSYQRMRRLCYAHEIGFSNEDEEDEELAEDFESIITTLKNSSNDSHSSFS